MSLSVCTEDLDDESGLMLVMLITIKTNLDLTLPKPPLFRKKTKNIAQISPYNAYNIGLPSWSLLSHGGKIEWRNPLTIFSIVAIPVVSVSVFVILCPGFQLVKPYLYFATPLLKF